MTISRRQALKFTAVAGSSLLLPMEVQHAARGAVVNLAGKPFTPPFKKSPVLQPVRGDDVPGSNLAFLRVAA